MHRLVALTGRVDAIVCAEQGLGPVVDSGTSYFWSSAESEHPYTPASPRVWEFKFPAAVRWIVVEFDPRCATAQAEDRSVAARCACDVLPRGS